MPREANRNKLSCDHIVVRMIISKFDKTCYYFYWSIQLYKTKTAAWHFNVDGYVNHNNITGILQTVKSFMYNVVLCISRLKR